MITMITKLTFLMLNATNKFLIWLLVVWKLYNWNLVVNFFMPEAINYVFFIFVYIVM